MSTLVPKIKLQNARAWAPRSPIRWLAALVIFTGALLVRMALQDFMGPRFPLLFFTLATLVVHFFLGLGPAILVALISLPAGDYFFVPPYLSFQWPDREDLFLIGYFVTSTVVVMTLIQYLRRAQYQAVLLAEIAESRYLMLLDSEVDRATAEAQAEVRHG
jgi:K+-sensing histidine kinase KdpD